MDLNANLHGNWTLENAKARLNQFFQKEKTSAEYKYSQVGPDHNRSGSGLPELLVQTHTHYCHSVHVNRSGPDPGQGRTQGCCCMFFCWTAVKPETSRVCWRHHRGLTVSRFSPDMDDPHQLLLTAVSAAGSPWWKNKSSTVHWRG